MMVLLQMQKQLQLCLSHYKKDRGLYRRITTSTIFKFNVLYLTKNSWQTYLNLLLALGVTGVQTKGSACWSAPSDFSVNLLDIRETKEINH